MGELINFNFHIGTFCVLGCPLTLKTIGISRRRCLSNTIKISISTSHRNNSDTGFQPPTPWFEMIAGTTWHTWKRVHFLGVTQSSKLQNINIYLPTRPNTCCGYCSLSLLSAAEHSPICSLIWSNYVIPKQLPQTKCSHADTTWEYIVRDDFSTFHVADFDIDSGDLVDQGAVRC